MTRVLRQWKDRMPWWVHFALAASLVVLTFGSDLFKPFGKPYSIVYLVPVLYAGWTMRGRWELAIYGLALAAALSGPLVRPDGADRHPISSRRWVGIGFGLLLMALMRERRRYSEALAEARGNLESKVEERTAELQRLNEEYQRLVKVKEQFLSNMSHEIRTPLNGILGMTELLQRSGLTTPQQALAHDLQISGQSLRAIVDDILDLARIEAGRLELKSAPFRMPDLLDEVLTLVRLAAETKDLELSAAISAPEVAGVEGDRDRLRQVLVNLAGNAVKYTDEGTVRIEVECRERATSEASARVRFTVRDSGIGIAAEDQARIFDAFTQVDSSAKQRPAGSGLGLAISRELVQLMGGQMGVESEPGRGSAFWFEVPLALRDGAADSGSEPGQTAVQRGLRVCIAEDDSVNRRLLEIILKTLGCSVEVAASGRELLDLLARSRFDLAIVDCHMPELDGFETARAIRAREANTDHRTGIVACSASVLQEDRDACFAAGMDAFIAKPIHFGEVEQILARWSGSTSGRVAAHAAGRS